MWFRYTLIYYNGLTDAICTHDPPEAPVHVDSNDEEPKIEGVGIYEVSGTSAKSPASSEVNGRCVASEPSPASRWRSVAP